MGKKRISLILTGFIIVVSFFIFIAIKIPPSMTGFATYASQPGPAEGKDTYIRQGVDTNFGSDFALRVGKTAAGVEFRSLIEFDTSSIPQGSTITSAILQIYISNAVNLNNVTIKAFRITSNWTESEAGWNNRTSSSLWGSTGGDYTQEDGSIAINQTGYYNISIINMVRNWIDGTAENFGIMLLSEDAENGNYKEISSSDSLTEEQRPKLIITHEENARPIIDEIQITSLPLSPIQVGNQETFTVYWTDLEGDSAQLFVCNTSNITTSGCEQKTFCSTSLAQTNPATCSYSILESDNRTMTAFISMCDENNCSDAEEIKFYINHPPSLILIQPSGGETLNQSQGNYIIRFNASDKNSDNLNFSVYYGSTQYSTTNLITNLNLSSCSNPNNSSANNNCSYSWNTTGLYGIYFLTIIANDSFTTSTISSSSSFNIRSIIDNEPPQISNIIYNPIAHSGQSFQVSATIIDENSISAWVSQNYSSQNISMTNAGSSTFTANITAPQIGTHSFKIFASDILGNTGSTDWQTFHVSKPNATSLNELSPSTALPYHTIRISSDLFANNSLRNVYAYLNVPDGFYFMSGYPQNHPMGNFTTSQTKTAEWFISTPLQENAYTLNVTYRDEYDNEWQSDNFHVQITSSIGGYDLSVNGYPIVETSNNYYVESYFRQNGIYTDADETKISITDSLGNPVLGPVSMGRIQTGRYNYSYLIGPAVNEGQWRTLINATKNSISYYAEQFWKVVGGPFDLRDIQIIKSSVSTLNISFIAENTGGANKDLILIWNLTRIDNDEQLDSGSETFMVEANSEKRWYIYPTTNYIGQVKITLIGYYSGTEKIGAYRIFSTTASNDTTPPQQPQTPSSGGGTAAPSFPSIPPQIYDLNIIVDKEINLTKNTEKKVLVKIHNPKNTELTNIKISIEGIPLEVYSIYPNSFENIGPNQTKELTIKFMTSEEIDEEIKFIVKTNEIEKKETIRIKTVPMIDYLLNEILRLRNKIEILKDFSDDKTKKEITKCEKILDLAEESFNNEKYIDAKKEIQQTEECLNKIKMSDRTDKIIGIDAPYWVWIITWSFLFLLIIALIIIVIVIYKKFKNKTPKIEKDGIPKSKKNEITEKIKEVSNRIKRI
jgi:hypothetical protein